MEQNTLWVNKEPSFGHKINEQKGSVVIFLAALLIAYILAVFVARFWGGTTFGIIQPLLFLAIGFFHVNRLQNDFQALSPTQKWTYTIIVAVTVFLLFGLASFWKIQLPLITMLAAPLAFLFPFVVSELLRLYMQLTFGNAAIWQVTNEASLTYPDVYLAGIPVRFRVMLEEGEGPLFQTDFRTRADMNLGEVFYDMVNKQTKKGNDELTLFDNEKQPYKWLFYTSGFLGLSRALDPKISLADNSLKKDSVVYVLRLPAGTNVLPYELQEKKELNYMS